MSSAALPPGPRGLEVWRIFSALREDPCSFQEKVRERWGPTVGFRLGPDLVVLSFRPDTIAEVLLDKRGIWVKDKVTAGLSAMLGDGLLTSEGAHWRRQRKLVAPALGKRRVESYAAAMVSRAEDAARELTRLGAASPALDVHGPTTRATLAIVLDTLFGAELEGDAERVGRAVDEAMGAFESLARTFYRFLPEWLPTPPRRTTNRAKRELDEVMSRVIEARRAGPRGDDLLSALLDATDDAGVGMSPAQLRDEIVTMFVAGHETTANALSFALFLLAGDPAAARRATAEVDAAFAALGDVAPEGAAERGARAIALAGRLPFVDAVIKETMRLYPPAYLLGRSPTEPVTLDGFALPAGVQVLVPVWAMHRDPAHWPDPERFVPGRWLDGAGDKVHRGVYLPFGGGPRVCVGNHFAQMEATLVLGVLLRRLRFERGGTADERPKLQAAVTLRPRGEMRLAVQARPAA